MQFAIRAYDGENMLEKRMEVRPRHLENMAKVNGKVLCAGGLLDENGKMKGSLLIMDFDSRALLDEYLNSEPYITENFFLFYTLRYGFEPSKAAALAMCAYPELPEQNILNAAKRFYRRFFAQQYKRSCLPDGPKVGSVTLSPRGDWRMPSDAACRMWIEDLG